MAKSVVKYTKTKQTSIECNAQLMKYNWIRSDTHIVHLISSNICSKQKLMIKSNIRDDTALVLLYSLYFPIR